MKAFLDTNFLTIPFTFRVDIVSEIERLAPGAELVTVRQVVEELKEIDDKKSGKMALEMIERLGIRVEDADGGADDALLEKAAAEHGAVCTNDAELKKRCIARNVPVIFMRKKRYLETTGGI